MGVYRASAQILSGRKGKRSVGFADVVTEFNSSGTYNGALGIQEHTVLVGGGDAPQQCQGYLTSETCSVPQGQV